MKLSRRGEYALRAMLYLVVCHGPGLVQGGRIARQERIPEKFLEQILRELKHAGLLESQVGPKGGYRLARPASQITVGQVVRAIEGPLAPLLDARRLQDRLARDPMHAGLYRVLLEVRDAIAGVLDRATLATVAEQSRAGRKGFAGTLSYQI